MISVASVVFLSTMFVIPGVSKNCDQTERRRQAQRQHAEPKMRRMVPLLARVGRAAPAPAVVTPPGPAPSEGHDNCINCGLGQGRPCIFLTPPSTSFTPLACSDMDVAKLEVWPFDNRPGRTTDTSRRHRYTLPPVPGTVLLPAGRAPACPRRPSRPSSAPELELDVSLVDAFVSATKSRIAAPPRPMRQAPTPISKRSNQPGETKARRMARQGGLAIVTQMPGVAVERSSPLSDMTNASLAMRPRRPAKTRVAQVKVGAKI